MEERKDLPEKVYEEIQQTDDDETQDLEYAEHPKFQRIMDYIGTKRGDITIGRLISILEQLSPAAKQYIESIADVRKEAPTIEYKKWWWLLIVRFLVVISALVSAIYLKYTGNLDATTSLIIVTVATVFFSFGRKSDN